MRAIRLVAMCDEYDTKPGLVLKGCASFDGLMADRDGTLTAHDVLEHQNGIAAMGPVWDEWEGQEFVLRYGDGDAICSLVYEADYY